MKKYTILLALVILSAVSAANAQVKQITQDEFYAASGKAFRLMSERARRIIIKIDDIENGAVVSSLTRTEEQIFPDKERYVNVDRKGSQESVSEVIIIGSKMYRRENNGDWVVGFRNGQGSGAGFSRTSCAQFTEEDTSIDGVFARKLSNLDISKEGNVLTFENYSVWYDQQGFFLRSERVTGLLEPRIEKSRTVTTYEYDPKDLRIEAPVK